MTDLTPEQQVCDHFYRLISEEGYNLRPYPAKAGRLLVMLSPDRDSLDSRKRYEEFTLLAPVPEDITMSKRDMEEEQKELTNQFSMYIDQLVDEVADEMVEEEGYESGAWDSEREIISMLQRVRTEYMRLQSLINQLKDL